MSLIPVEASILKEASRNSKLSTDIDKFRNKYYDVDTENNLEVTFPSFDILTFERNYFIMLNACQKVAFKNRWYMRPDYVSFDYYNTTIYWPLIMYLNNCFTREEFIDFETILVPPYQVIFQLFTNRQVDKNLIPVKEENIDSDIFVNQFYKKYPLDKLELERNAANEELLGKDNLNTLGIYNTEKTETITLTTQDIKNKYIDLQRIPSNSSSLTLTLNNFSIVQRYNYDYTLTYNELDELKRISWKTSDIIENSGVSGIVSSMGNYIRVGTIFNITYAVSIPYRLSDGIPSV